MRKPFPYDPELMEKARWIVERGLDRPPQHEIERQLELPLPMPRREPEKTWTEVLDQRRARRNQSAVVACQTWYANSRQK